MEPIDIFECAECGLPAEMLDWYELESTSGPLAHYITECVQKHVRTLIHNPVP